MRFQIILALFQDEEVTKLSSQVKQTDEERSRLAHTCTTQQTQMDKFKKMADEAKNKAESLETQLSAQRKV